VSTALNIVFAISVLVLSASGLAIVFGLMGVINFAHGELMMLGAFAAVWTSSFGAYWLALAIAPVAVGVGSLFVERVLIRPLYHRTIETILATYGLAIVIREVMKLFVGADFRSIHDPLGTTASIAGTTYPTFRLLVIAFSVALLLGVGLLVVKTRVGLRVRAVLQNPELAAGLGVNVTATYRAAFGVGCGLAAFAGALLAPLVTVHPEMGPDFLVGSFLTVILAGAGSALGLGASAGVLGTTQTLVTTWLTATAGLIAILVVVVVVMRLRPSGLSRSR
jgi:urea transport system permease protein